MSDCAQHESNIECGWCAAENVLAKAEHYRADRDLQQHRVEGGDAIRRAMAEKIERLEQELRDLKTLWMVP